MEKFLLQLLKNNVTSITFKFFFDNGLLSLTNLASFWMKCSKLGHLTFIYETKNTTTKTPLKIQPFLTMLVNFGL